MTAPVPLEVALAAPERLVRQDLVNGFTRLEQLDTLVHKISHFTRQGPTLPVGPRRLCEGDHVVPYRLSNNGTRSFYCWTAGNLLPSDAIRVKQPTTKYRHVFALMLDSTLDEAGVGAHTIRITLGADLAYTGRGVVGRSLQLLTMRQQPISFATSASYTKLPAHNAEAAADIVALEAADIAHAVIVNGLRRVVSGGLPGLGRRR